MSNIIFEKKQFKEWRFNKWYFAIESDHDRNYRCVTCPVKYNSSHDTSKQCGVCALKENAPRINRGENWEER